MKIEKNKIITYDNENKYFTKPINKSIVEQDSSI